MKGGTAIYYGEMGSAARGIAKPYGQAVATFVDGERKLRVLIVDDEPSVRRTVRRILGKDFFAFLEAADLDAARAALKCHTPPDIIVLDLALQTDRPEEGFDFLREVNEQPAQTPVVVFSGRADVKIAVQAMHLGAIDVLEKGETAETLRDAIRRGLERVIAMRSQEGKSVRRMRSAPIGADDHETADEEEIAERSLEDDLAAILPRRRKMNPLEHYVYEFKRQVVAEAIARAGGNLTDAARVLQMRRGNFHRLAIGLGLHAPGVRATGDEIEDESDESPDPDSEEP